MSDEVVSHVELEREVFLGTVVQVIKAKDRGGYVLPPQPEQGADLNIVIIHPKWWVAMSLLQRLRHRLKVGRKGMPLRTAILTNRIVSVGESITLYGRRLKRVEEAVTAWVVEAPLAAGRTA